jgi:membrane associated rhomboid family serine protease
MEPAAPGARDPEGLREVARGRPRLVREQALVLAAMGIDHEVAGAGDEALIRVRAADEARARAELGLYERENRAWPAPDELPEVLTEAALGVALWCAFLFVAFFGERNQLLGFDWWSAGKLRGGEVREGEWWRALTALALHEDLLHLASNMVFGALFVGIACQVMGTGLAFFAVLAAGFGGNLANAWIQGPGFSAIGSSTAVFGALGILGGYRAVHRLRAAHRPLRRRALLPLLACVFLLGAYGAGGEDAERVDVLGHALGFAVGLALGGVYGRLGARAAPGRCGQALFGAAALALMGAAWWLALAR